MYLRLVDQHCTCVLRQTLNRLKNFSVSQHVFDFVILKGTVCTNMAKTNKNTMTFAFTLQSNKQNDILVVGFYCYFSNMYVIRTSLWTACDMVSVIFHEIKV